MELSETSARGRQLSNQRHLHDDETLNGGARVPHTESICALPAGNGPPAELESKSSES
jgi:hypothetical protein